MRLTRIAAQDFRGIAQLDFAPAPGLNVVRGGNAQGKTSVLEAVLYAATSKSHRTSDDDALVRHGAPGFSVTLDAQRADRAVSVLARMAGGAKRYWVNGVAQTRISDILGRVHVVFFSPEEIELVRGGAAGRRRFLDMELSQVSPPYLAALQQFRQALRQRNELLRRGNPDADQLDAWDAQLARHAAPVAAARAEFVAQLAPLAAAVHAQIAAGEALDILYRPDLREGEAYADLLARTRAADLKRSQTGRGPHRDDLDFLVGGRDARAYASQGQQKTAALAVKLAEVALVYARAGEYPVLLLDEVLAELDHERAARLFAAVPDAVQCFITTTEPRASLRDFGRPAASYRIQHGVLEAEI